MPRPELEFLNDRDPIELAAELSSQADREAYSKLLMLAIHQAWPVDKMRFIVPFFGETPLRPNNTLTFPKSRDPGANHNWYRIQLYGKPSEGNQRHVQPLFTPGIRPAAVDGDLFVRSLDVAEEQFVPGLHVIRSGSKKAENLLIRYELPEGVALEQLDSSPPPLTPEA